MNFNAVNVRIDLNTDEPQHPVSVGRLLVVSEQRQHRCFDLGSLDLMHSNRIDALEVHDRFPDFLNI